MGHVYRKRPSELLAIDDPYTAYCLDEACALIVQHMQNGDEPKFHRECSSFAELYKQY